MRLPNRCAVVTGASSGIGRAVAVALAREGADVIVNYRRSTDAARDCVAEIRRHGRRAEAISADVGEPREVARLVREAVALLGGIDIWINMAGADILTGEGARLPDEEKLARLIDTDLRGTMLASWAAAQELAKRPGASLVNTSWDQALTGMGGRNPEMFAAVKAGISGFTRALARSLAPGVRVNEVAPGWIETAFAAQDMTAEYRARVEECTPMRKFGQPQDVAEAVVYLVSDEASFVTGQTLRVNGGLVS